MEGAFLPTKDKAHCYFHHTCTCVFPSLNNLYLPAKWVGLIWVFVLQERESGAFGGKCNTVFLYLFIPE